MAWRCSDGPEMTHDALHCPSVALPKSCQGIALPVGSTGLVADVIIARGMFAMLSLVIHRHAVLNVAQKRCNTVYRSCWHWPGKPSSGAGETHHESLSGSERNEAEFWQHNPYIRTWCFPGQKLTGDQHRSIGWLQVQHYFGTCFWDLLSQGCATLLQGH